MTKRTRILFLILGIVTLAAAVWITITCGLREISFTDDAVDIKVIAPAGS